MDFSIPVARAFRKGAAAVPLCLLSASLAAGLACEEKSPPPPQRTEPWLKDDAEEGVAARKTTTRYQVVPQQTLSLSLPGKKRTPVGTLSGITGEFDISLDELSQSRGTFRIDLTRLRMGVPPSEEVSPPTEGDPPASSSGSADDATRLALNWLGLGPQVPTEEQTKNRSAVFEIFHLRELSHPSAEAGPAKQDGSEQVREVLATAEGELSLRGYSVKRQVALLLQFRSPSGTSGPREPTHIDVSLRPDAQVPLAEYLIQPRDEAGRIQSDKRDLIGKEVGGQAKITGKIRLQKVGPSQTSPRSDRVGP